MSLSFMGGLYEIACAENGKPNEIQLRCLLLGETLFELPQPFEDGLRGSMYLIPECTEKIENNPTLSGHIAC